MSKFKEFLLTVHFDGMFPRLFFNKFVHIDTFELKEEQLHVIEYAALEQANAKIKELEAKLEIAVERLEKLAADGYANQIDKRALEKLRGGLNE